MIPRACLTCQWFRLYLETPDVSEVTPGSPAEITCGNLDSMWWSPRRSTQPTNPFLDTPTLITIAEKCDEWEPHTALLIRDKGGEKR